MNSLNNYYETIKFLKSKQIFFRIYFKLKKKKLKNEQNLQRTFTPLIIKPLKKKSLNFKNNKSYFLFLNRKILVKNFRLNENNFPKLLIYNLHYFDYLNDHKNKNFYNINKLQLIYEWIEFIKLKPISFGLDAYPTSLRISNWIKWIIENKIDDNVINTSLYSQLCYLEGFIEYNILANHLIANAKALIFGGLFFSGSSSKLIYKKGIKLLMQEIDNQILDDGGHFEQSPMYHNIILEDFLDIYNVLKSYKKFYEIKKLKLENIIRKMLKFSYFTSHPDNDVSFFNDSCFEISSNFPDLLKYATKLNILKKNNFKKSTFEDFPFSGYSIFKNKTFYLIYDRADIKSDYQAGHSHADILSFELSYLNNRFLVNSGINTYENNKLRHKQRGSKTHNTLVVNDTNSTNVWHSFRTGNRAKILNKRNIINKNFINLEGSHDGYIKKFNTNHTRSLTIKNTTFIVKDYVSSSKKVDILIHFYFYEGLEFKEISNNNYLLKRKNFQVNIMIEGECSSKISDTLFFPTFGVSKTNKCLKIKSSIKGNNLIKTTFVFQLNV